MQTILGSKDKIIRKTRNRWGRQLTEPFTQTFLLKSDLPIRKEEKKEGAEKKKKDLDELKKTNLDMIN